MLHVRFAACSRFWGHDVGRFSIPSIVLPAVRCPEPDERSQPARQASCQADTALAMPLLVWLDAIRRLQLQLSCAMPQLDLLQCMSQPLARTPRALHSAAAPSVPTSQTDEWLVGAGPSQSRNTSRWGTRLLQRR
jgi:hypothetical protein